MKQARKTTKWGETLGIELQCREMINSCLIYGPRDFIGSQYSNSYIKQLGETRVKELYEEQKRDFDKSRVIKNVGEDAEGGVYHGIRWFDE